jgi:hypothetical protein
VTDRAAHETDLPLAALMDNHPQEGVALLVSDFVHFGRGRHLAFDFDTLSQALHGCGGWATAHESLVLFLDAETRVRQPKSKVAVIGE